MASISLKGKAITTTGTLPAVGTIAPDVTLTGVDLADVKLSDLKGKKVINIFPSLDTGVCAMSVRTFAQKVAGKGGMTVVNVSADLPFAHKRFCTAEGISGVVNLSSFRSNFAEAWGLKIAEGGMKGLCSRSVVVLDADNKVLYTEQVPEITTEPNYEAALAKVS
jgi:thiol peroxidase